MPNSTGSNPATVGFGGDELLVELKPGNFMNISVHKKHRVKRTTPDEPTVWPAVHYG
jgi:cupin 2 domain-containing protein